MNERDFTIDDQNYKLCKLDAFKQFHIVRRIAPILSDLLPAVGQIAKMGGKDSALLSEEEKFEQIAQLAGPLMTGLSNLSDEDSNKVLFGLLSSVERQQTVNGGWARVATESMLMFQDLELPTMLQLAGRAFVYNMAGFFKLLPQVSKEGAPKLKTQ